MKKSFLFAVAMVAFVSCKKEVTVTPATGTQEMNAVTENQDIVTDLPENIRGVINKYYSQNDIASYELKNVPVIGKSYEVKFNHGAEIDFDENGEWHEWSDPKGLPEDVLPEHIENYLKQHYANTFAVSIDKEKTKIKVDLASGLDLEFDTDSNFIRIDD